MVPKVLQACWWRLIVAGFCAAPFLLSAAAPEEDVYITCKPAYYMEETTWKPRVLKLIDVNAGKGALTNFSAGYAVMTVMTPEKFAGKMLTLFIDHAVAWCEPDQLYDGFCKPSAIGTLAFDWGTAVCTDRMPGPLTNCSPEDLTGWIARRYFGEHFLRVLKEQRGEKVFFEVMYGVFTNNSSAYFCSTGLRTNTFTYRDQNRAGAALRKHRIPCPLSARDAFRGTFGNWDESVGEWPA